MDIRVWLQLINMVGTFALGVWLYLEKRSDKTNDRITDLAVKVDALDKDVSSLKTAAAGAPDHADLARVYESINNLAATLNQLVGETRVQSENLRLILNQVAQKGMK
ncbi:MAG: hypothetical protein H3C26_07210 [Rhodocyclaceae bacterium]|nr:hypothetical protein [Rhodocyclaceae bacterium]